MCHSKFDQKSKFLVKNFSSNSTFKTEKFAKNVYLYRISKFLVLIKVFQL